MGLLQYAMIYCQLISPWVILAEPCWNTGFVRRPSLSHEFTQDRQRWVTFRWHSDSLYCTREHLSRIQLYVLQLCSERLVITK